MKHLLTLVSFAIIATLFVPILAKAQVVNLPGIYVKDLSLDKTTYNSGDTVKGTFTLSNTENYAVSNIYYMVLLMGDYKNTVPNTQYDHTTLIGPFNFSAGEKKTVDFSYNLPKGLGGDGLGIQIHAAMQNGTGLGWADSMIKVTGSGSFLKFTEGYVEIGKNKFGLQEGPMVYEGSKAYLNVTFKNPSTSAISATPDIKIYNRSETNGLLKEFNQDKVTIKANGSVSLKIELPNFNFDPKVYIGKLDLVDDSGNKVAPTTDFRYIVYGDIVTINQVTVDRESIQKGESLVVTVNYSGAPFDVMSGKTATSTPADLSINIFNEENKLVGSYSGKEDFNAKTQSILNISAEENAKTLRVEVTASRNGKILAKYTTTFEGDKNKVNPNSGFFNSLGVKGMSALIIVIVALLSLVFIRIVSRSKVLLIIIAFVIIVFAVVFFSTNSSVKAFTIDTNHSITSFNDTSGCTDYHCTQIYNVFVNSPSGNYGPGQAASLQVGASASACGNRAMYFTISALGKSNEVVRDQYAPGNLYNTLSVPFTTATTSGSHSISFSMKFWNYDSSNTADLTGHQDYTVVVPPPPAPTLSVASGLCEDGVYASWHKISNADSYSLFVDGVSVITTASTTYHYTASAASSTHTYTIKANNSGGSSVLSNAITLVTPGLCPVVGPVSGLTSGASVEPGQCNGKIDLSWSIVRYASYYNIIRYNPVTGMQESVASTSATIYRDTVEPGTAHAYAVQAFNSVSNTAISPLRTATSTYDCTPTMISSCYAIQDGMPTLNVRSGQPMTWVGQIAGGVEPYNYTWFDNSSGNRVMGIGTTTANVLASTVVTYTNNSSTPSTKSVTLLSHSGSGAYYREASTNCSVDVWKSINELSTSTVACSIAPASGNVPRVNQLVNWSMLVSQPGLSQLTYSWTGSDGLSGTQAVIPKIYTTVGTKYATSTVFGKDSSGQPYLGVCATSTEIISGGAVQEQ
jgi:hypothetical protein